MSKHFVVAIERKGFRFPKLTIVVLAQGVTPAAGRRFITDTIMAAYDKKVKGTVRQWASIRIKEYRVVDEKGLKRLRAAAKASITLSRRRAAKKAAATRKRNRELGIVRPAKTYYRPYGY
jgi:hypothetical protein